MTTVPLGEAKATDEPPHGPPTASLDTEAGDRPGDSSAGESQGQVPLPADVSAQSPAASSEPQDVAQAPFEMATREAESTSGDKDQSEAAPDSGQEKREEVTALLPQTPGTLQVFVAPQNSELDPGAQGTRATQGHVTFSDDAQGQEDIPQRASASKKHPGVALSPPNAEAPSGGAASPSPALEDQPPDLGGGSGARQAGPAGSPSPSPGTPGQAPRPGLLDPSLYAADGDYDYMRSMTSLLGGGEGSISSLADVLVWSDTTMGMGVAVGCLASGRSSPTELLRSPGPSLRSLSSILGSASAAFSSGLAAGTSSALRGVTHALESVERRTVDGVRSAVRYLTSHLPPRRAPAGPDSD